MNESKELYGNIRVVPPKGDIVMFRTTLQRAQWYVDRELAVFETLQLELGAAPNGPAAHGTTDLTSVVPRLRHRCSSAIAVQVFEIGARTLRHRKTRICMCNACT